MDNFVNVYSSKCVIYQCGINTGWNKVLVLAKLPSDKWICTICTNSRCHQQQKTERMLSVPFQKPIYFAIISMHDYMVACILLFVFSNFSTAVRGPIRTDPSLTGTNFVSLSETHWTFYCILSNDLHKCNPSSQTFVSSTCLCSGPAWVDQAPGGGKDSEQAEDPQSGCGGEDSTRDPEPQTLPSPAYNQTVSTDSFNLCANTQIMNLQCSISGLEYATLIYS